MGLHELDRRREPEHHPILDRTVRPGAVGPQVKPRSPPRLEIRICRVDGLWEVRPGAYGPKSRHDRLAFALGTANELARRAWIDDGLLSSVKRLTDDGTWEIEGVFGVVP